MSKVYIQFDKSNKFRSWRKKVWIVRDQSCWYSYCHKDPRWFCSRNAAIMWLKRYGDEKAIYRFGKMNNFGAAVRVENGYVYFYNPEYGLMFPAESKRTQPYAVRNN